MPSPQRPNSQSIEPKPYDCVTFPLSPPPKKAPAGQDQYLQGRVHGSLHLELTVATGVHVSTGMVMMGKDVDESKLPLIKTMLKNKQKVPLIPGSSLKGVVRSIYEAITNSTLGVITNKYKSEIPKDRLPCDKKDKLCPASQVFGALDWQGLISFRDAYCVKSKFTAGFMPSLYRPRPDQRRQYFNPVARKFYYHAVKAISGGDRGIPIQQIGQQQVFTTQLQIKNLTEAELGTLLIALGQDPNYPFALKVGAGKPIGMGTMEVKISKFVRPQSLRDRYHSYGSTTIDIEGEALTLFVQKAIAVAHQAKLVQLEQLKQLQQILKYPTERNAPRGMY